VTDTEITLPVGAWLSVLPPIVAIVLALGTRQVLLSLFAGLWVGSLLIEAFAPLDATARSLEFLQGALGDPDHITIILFSLLLGGMVGVMARSAGSFGAVAVLRRRASSRRRGELLASLSAFVVFFDDYANTLVRGNALRPMTDELRISREKLAYIVDSTAAPLAVCAVLTTWIGFEITQIRKTLADLSRDASQASMAAQLKAGSEGAFTIFLDSVPYLFYPILSLGFVLMVGALRRDFGPMLAAERRAARGGGVLRAGSRPAADTELVALSPAVGAPARWYNAVVPVIVVVAVAATSLYGTGRAALAGGDASLREIIGASDPFAALLWASFAGCCVAIALPVAQRILSLSGALDA